MHFEVDISVTIGDKRVDTVSSFKTRFDSGHVGSIVEIVVPLNCCIQYQNGRHDFLTAYALDLFKVGDPVVIVCSMTTEGGVKMPDVELFRGYVWDFKLGMPLLITCIDYLPLLGHLQNITNYKGSLRNLIHVILKDTGITLLEPTVDFDLVNFTLRSISPWAILTHIKKETGLNITLENKELFCNVASTTRNLVKFATDRNVYSTRLQKPENVWQGYRVKAWFLKNNGTRDSIELGDTEGHCTDVYFYNIAGGEKVWLNLANEALLKLKQRKYYGDVGGFLYPVVKLYDKIAYTDIRYPEKSGNYVCTAISHSMDDNGLLVNMRWAYLTDLLNVTIS